jgi:hypothetical protein
LFLNQPLPYRALYLTFRILLATRKCSFSLKICWAFKSAAQLIFSIENLKLKKKKKKKSPPALEGPLRSSCQEGTTFYLLLTVEVLCARTGTHWQQCLPLYTKTKQGELQTWKFESWDDATRPMNVWFQCVHITMSHLLIMLHFCQNGLSCWVCFQST